MNLLNRAVYGAVFRRHGERLRVLPAAQVVLDGDRLRLRQLAMGQQHPQLLAAQRLHMHRTVKPHPHHLRDAARIVAVGHVDLRLQHRLHVPRLHTDHR
jgi:hypothetical protein